MRETPPKAAILCWLLWACMMHRSDTTIRLVLQMDTSAGKMERMQAERRSQKRQVCVGCSGMYRCTPPREDQLTVPYLHADSQLRSVMTPCSSDLRRYSKSCTSGLLYRALVTSADCDLRCHFSAATYRLGSRFNIVRSMEEVSKRAI
jgi:hypothetical protein